MKKRPRKLDNWVVRLNWWVRRRRTLLCYGRWALGRRRGCRCTCIWQGGWREGVIGSWTRPTGEIVRELESWKKTWKYMPYCRGWWIGYIIQSTVRLLYCVTDGHQTSKHSQRVSLYTAVMKRTCPLRVDLLHELFHLQLYTRWALWTLLRRSFVSSKKVSILEG